MVLDIGPRYRHLNIRLLVEPLCSIIGTQVDPFCSLEAIMAPKRAEARKNSAKKAYDKYIAAKMRRRILEGKVAIARQAEKNLRDIYEAKKDAYDDERGPTAWLIKIDVLGGCRRPGGAWGSQGGTGGARGSQSRLGGARGSQEEPWGGRGPRTRTYFVKLSPDCDSSIGDSTDTADS